MTACTGCRSSLAEMIGNNSTTTQASANTACTQGTCAITVDERRQLKKAQNAPSASASQIRLSSSSMVEFRAQFTTPRGAVHRTWARKGPVTPCEDDFVALSSLAGHLFRGVLVGTEAQQGSNPANAVELFVVPDVHDFDAVADGMPHDSVADVLQLRVLLAANNTCRRGVHIHVAALEAFHSRRQKVRAQQQRLHLADFQRAQHPAQPDRAAPVTMGLADDIADESLLHTGVEFFKQLQGRLLHLLWRRRLGVDAEVSYQALPGMRMQLWLDLRPDIVMAAHDQALATTALEVSLDIVCQHPEVLHRLVHLPALGVSAVVAAPAGTLAAPRKFVYEIQFFCHFFVHDLENSGLGTIGEQHAYTVHTIDHRGQRLQMKALVQQDVGLGQLGGNIKLAPESLLAAGEYRLGLAPITT